MKVNRNFYTANNMNRQKGASFFTIVFLLIIVGMV